MLPLVLMAGKEFETSYYPQRADRLRDIIEINSTQVSSTRRQFRRMGLDKKVIEKYLGPRKKVVSDARLDLRRLTTV